MGNRPSPTPVDVSGARRTAGGREAEATNQDRLQSRCNAVSLGFVTAKQPRDAVPVTMQTASDFWLQDPQIFLLTSRRAPSLDKDA